MQNTRVVITGVGVIAPNGIGQKEFWSSISNGISGVKAYTWGERFGFKGVAMGRVDGFVAAEHGVTDDRLAHYGRYLQFALAAAKMAVEDARLDVSAVTGTRFGVALASAIADAAKMEQNLLILTDNGRREARPELVERRFVDNFDFGVAAAEMARTYGAAGPVFNVSTGCTAGVDALGIALDKIRRGDADVMLAGASEAPLCPLAIGSFEALGALSTRFCAKTQEATCPYSLERDGFVIAEGCGIFVMESYEHAMRRGARIYAEVAGYASTNNAYHMTDLAPDGRELARCILLALSDAQCTPDEVDHIGAHGSSTPQNDTNETGAIKQVFGARAANVPMNSLKSMTGHALAAANAVEVVALCLEMKNGFVHPTINYRTPDPECDLNYVVGAGRSARIGTAVKLSSGFSGIHSAIVLKAA